MTSELVYLIWERLARHIYWMGEEEEEEEEEHDAG